MAKKRASKSPAESASQTKAAAPKGRRKQAATSGAAAKAAAPQRAAKGEAKKVAVAVKLNDKQRDFLKRIKDAGEPGYAIGPKIEQRTINALQERKLVKRGVKNKETGTYSYVLTKAGEKQLAMPAPEAMP
jgi:hypothetical protein